MRLVQAFLLSVPVALAAIWSPALYAPMRMIGGPGGGAFNIVGEEGSIVTKIQVFRRNKGTPKFLRGIKVFFSDGTEKLAGVDKDESADFEFHANEKITSMTLWGNGIGTRSGRIRFKTSEGRSFDYGQETASNQAEFDIDVGEGYLLGFMGHNGDDIDKLGPVFLNRLARRSLDDVVIEDFPKDQGLHILTLDKAEASFNGIEYKFHFGGSKQRGLTTTWTVESSDTLTAGLSMEAGIPGIGSVTASASWSTTQTMSVSRSQTDDRVLDWGLDIDINGPEDSSICEAQVWEGNIDLKWNGNLHLATQDNPDRVISVPTKGTMKRVDVSSVISSCSRKSDGRVVAGSKAGLSRVYTPNLPEPGSGNSTSTTAGSPVPTGNSTTTSRVYSHRYEPRTAFGFTW
ncbi:hypothetical protein B0H63DRAFT_535188 [Podospora didyma]|uniref:Jacalin-type lectin domain-containing protein n=1 Tax=Podospora didyma TaxID=330526 RepID=A0AAE0N3C4_9PEZI|nr:hypothetical protein B0H63DRAFT_535188 [Podospora didyma]